MIQSGAKISENVTVGSHCNICNQVEIGANSSIQTGCHITRGVKIGENCFLGPGVITMNDKYMDGAITPPTIGNNTRIGGGSCIFPDVKIGHNVIIGAGSIVTKDVPDNTEAWGNPAKTKSKI